MFWEVLIKTNSGFRETVLVVADNGFEAMDRAGLFVPDYPFWNGIPVQYDPKDDPDDARELFRNMCSVFNDRFIFNDEISREDYVAGHAEYLKVGFALIDTIGRIFV